MDRCAHCAVPDPDDLSFGGKDRQGPDREADDEVQARLRRLRGPDLRVLPPAAQERARQRMKTIEEGATATDFELQDQTRTPRRLSELLRSGPVVLFFYPGAMTSGCTAESCHFRDLSAEFAAVGAQPVGISTDAPGKQAEFDRINSLGFPLLSDVDGAVATSFGVKRRFLTPVKRVTLVIAQDRTIVKVIGSKLSMQTHADTALRYLRERRAAA